MREKDIFTQTGRNSTLLNRDPYTTREERSRVLFLHPKNQFSHSLRDRQVIFSSGATRGYTVSAYEQSKKAPDRTCIATTEQGEISDLSGFTRLPTLETVQKGFSCSLGGEFLLLVSNQSTIVQIDEEMARLGHTKIARDRSILEQIEMY